MKLKSSNKGAYFLLSGLLVLIVLLAFFKSFTKKTSKYLSAPEGIEQKTTLSFIQLTFNEKSYKKLKAKRDKALSVGILESKDTDYVPATIGFNGKEYRAEVRLKGDWTDHLKDNKWSFRIKLKDDQTIMGMRKFSIHRPGSRGFINEWLYHKAIKKEDLMGLRYDFLEGMIHIKKANSSDYITKEVGIYAIEESFDKRTIESNKRKESIILKFDESGYWSAVKKNKQIGDPSGIVWHEFMDYKVDYPITVFGEDKAISDNTLHNYFKVSKNLLEDLRSKKVTVDKVFDIKELALQNAILNLFGATHGLPLINVRFYYNPITSKLEPIAFDGNSGARLNEYKHFNLIDKQKDSIYLKELAHAIQKVSKPSYLNELLNEYKREITNYRKILETEYKYPLFKEANIRYNQTILKKELLRLKTKYNLTDIKVDTINVSELKATNNIDVNLWKKRGTTLLKTSQKRQSSDVYKVERETTTKGAYIITADVSIESNELYEATIIVKKGNVGDYFGFRIQGQYPNRVDALFDINKGILIKGSKVGDFKYEGAQIEDLNNEWYKLTLKTRASIDIIKLVFGPTNKTKNYYNWESPTTNKPNSFIDASSVTIKKIN